MECDIFSILCITVVLQYAVLAWKRKDGIFRYFRTQEAGEASGETVGGKCEAGV